MTRPSPPWRPRLSPSRSAVTPMSELRAARAAFKRGNPAEGRATPPPARRLHDSAPVVVPLLLAGAIAGGCVIPPPLELDQPDAGANAAPVIQSVRDSQGVELTTPDPVTVTRGQGSMTVTVYDADPADIIYVRFFVDYRAGDPTNYRASCQIPAPQDGSRERTTSPPCDVGGLCLSSDVDQPLPRFLQIEVYDREVKDDVAPRFRAVEPPGQQSERDYLMTCVAPPT